MGLVRDIVSGLMCGVFPRTCEICGRSLVEGEQYMCLTCNGAMPRTYVHRSRVNRMEERLSRVCRIGRCASWFYYDADDVYARLIRLAKFGDRPGMAQRLGVMFASELKNEGFFDGIDILIPVPTSIARRLRRGYNQAEEIARGVSDVTGIGVCATAVKVDRGHESQTRHTGAERSINVRGVFKARDLSRVQGCHVLIIDDVFTTGSTVEELIKALGEAPAKVSVLTLGLARLK